MLSSYDQELSRSVCCHHSYSAPEVLASSRKQENEIFKNRDLKGKNTKPYICIWPQKSTRKLLELISEFSKFIRYKISLRKVIAKTCGSKIKCIRPLITTHPNERVGMNIISTELVH